MTGSALAGLRILIAEDEFMLATELADAVEREGGEVAAMVASLQDAERSADQPIDGAILDVQLGRRMSFDLARRLKLRGVPLIFTTGFSEDVVPDDLRDVPFLVKPAATNDVVRQAAAAFASDRSGSR